MHGTEQAIGHIHSQEHMNDLEFIIHQLEITGEKNMHLYEKHNGV